MTVRISAQAARQLGEIFENGIEMFGVGQAVAFQEALQEKFDLIGQQPFIGRRLGGVENKRRFPHFPYVILYEIHADSVLITAVIDGRSDTLGP